MSQQAGPLTLQGEHAPAIPRGVAPLADRPTLSHAPSPVGQQAQLVEQPEHFAAGLVDDAAARNKKRGQAGKQVGSAMLRQNRGPAHAQPPPTHPRRT